MIFVSYRKDDTGDLAQHLAAQLCERYGDESVFIDREHIEPGEGWKEKIEASLSRASVLVALIGPRWLTTYDEDGRRRLDRDDDVLVGEIGTALQRGIRIIPLYVHGARPLTTKALPSRIAAFAEQQGIQCADVKDISSLLAVLDAMQGLHPRPKQRGKWGLPPPKEDFTGREDESRDIINGIKKDGRRTVIIHGLPGTGKTQTALHIAELLRDQFPDGALFCDLRGFKDAPLTPVAAARSILLSMNPELQLPLQEDQVFAHYYSALAGKQMLLVLDDARDADQVERLLPASPVVVVMTSRKMIDIGGALRVPVHGFTDKDAISFLHRLNGKLIGSEKKIAAACGRLPLALRLAASALEKRPGLILDDYISQLENAASRSRYMPALQVQYDLLTDNARPKLVALAVFQNGFSLEAASAIWGIGPEEGDGILVDLYDLSLIVCPPGSQRYFLHDLVRQFVVDVSGQNVGIGVLQRYAEYFATVANGLNVRFLAGGSDLVAALQDFDDLADDIVKALQWAAANVRSDADAARACADLAWSCWYLFEHRRGLDAMAAIASMGVQAAQKLKDEEKLFAHMRRQGYIETYTDPQAALITLEKCLSYVQGKKKRREEGIIFGYEGLAHQALGQVSDANAAFMKSLTIARELNEGRGDMRQAGIALGRLGSMQEEQRNWADARAYYEQALSVEQAIGDGPGEVIDHLNCGRVCEVAGKLDDAGQNYAAAAKVAHAIADRRGVTALAFLCDVRSRDGACGTASDECGAFREALLDAVKKGKVYLAGVCSSLIEQAKWTAASIVADCMMQDGTAGVAAWTEKAYAVRRMSNGGIAAATDVLMDALKRFPAEWSVPFNLACYAAQIGNVDGAVQWLRVASKAHGDALAIKARAATDSDLSCLGPEIPGLTEDLVREMAAAGSVKPKAIGVSGRWQMDEVYAGGRTSVLAELLQVGKDVRGALIITDRPERKIGFVIEECVKGYVDGNRIRLEGVTCKVVSGTPGNYQLDTWKGCILDHATIEGMSADTQSVSGKFMMKRTDLDRSNDSRQQPARGDEKPAPQP